MASEIEHFAWVVWSPELNFYLLTTARSFAEDSIAAFLDRFRPAETKTWAQYINEGYGCHKIKLMRTK